MTTRKTTTVNIEKGSKLDQVVSAYAAETGSPYSVAMRSIAEKAIEAEDAFKRERLEAQRGERALRADIAGMEITVQQFKEELLEAQRVERALRADIAGTEITVLQLKEELSDARWQIREWEEARKSFDRQIADLRAMHSREFHRAQELEARIEARDEKLRALAENEDHAEEREALEARQEDLALREFALTLLAKRVKRALRETEEMIEDEEV